MKGLWSVKVGWDMKNPGHHIRTAQSAVLEGAGEVTQLSLALALFILGSIWKTA